jgi:RHS repeat-associated protein
MFGYCGNLGHPTDPENGLIYMRARFYEPWSGRFLSEDPAKADMNWYSYANSCPPSFTDPSGYASWTAWNNFMIGCAIGGFFMSDLAMLSLLPLAGAVVGAFLFSCVPLVGPIAGGAYGVAWGTAKLVDHLNDIYTTGGLFGKRGMEEVNGQQVKRKYPGLVREILGFIMAYGSLLDVLFDHVEDFAFSKAWEEG